MRSARSSSIVFFFCRDEGSRGRLWDSALISLWANETHVLEQSLQRRSPGHIACARLCRLLRLGRRHPRSATRRSLIAPVPLSLRSRTAHSSRPSRGSATPC